MPIIHILVERHEEGFTATAHDECGQVGGSFDSNLRAEAVRRAKQQAGRLLGVACRFVEEELGEGE